MGNRLSKITTRTGDKGTTGLGNGERIAKDHPRIETIGDIDELNCVIGIILTHPLPIDIQDSLTEIQHSLFDIGAELCMPDQAFIDPKKITQIETSIENYNATLPPLKEFVVPGGTTASAQCHFARTVCRRAERHLVSLTRNETINEHTLIYLNRLSDLLFVFARIVARTSNTQEPQWRSDRSAS